eukprot:TRINITY_DN5194_c0_g1_i1.p1 TRINITY_DN5194_c0_g1~~TRINITY_DN5194_c0_g1_i1.p1  ORF type:complete len:668 (-),score=266.49 TRINITY_DN5194_c0_g1_i1:374-2377(-)
MLTHSRTVLAVVAALLSSAGLAGQPRQADSEPSHPPPQDLKTEYLTLLSSTEDKIGLEAIRALHQQLDDDNDGTIEPSETGDFIKADLQYDGDGRREKLFHKKDTEITVPDLWLTWVKGEVHNWTVEQTVDWLKNNVDLPQYSEIFIKEGVDGRKLPRAASDPAFLSKVLGITSSIHRSKISLKAMDVVLFGPPKEPSHWLKDVILTSLLLALLTALFWAYRTKKHSEAHLSKMIKDMESLAKAEKALQDMQDRLVVQEQVIKKVKVEKVQLEQGEGGTEEVGRLREEVEILRGELHRAEVELEDRCWMAPTVLQHWLQLTYEIESQVYNSKRKCADSQMETAKDACEKLKRKRSSLVGAFVSTHGRSIDDVDKAILEAKTALMELTQDLSERSQRWRQIEMLTGVSIVNNPGILALQRLVRHVGGGNRAVRGGLSSRMSSMSVDDLHDDLETRSVAASHTSHLSSRQGGAKRNVFQTSSGRDFSVSRESSKESSNSESDELLMERDNNMALHRNRLVKQQSRVSEVSVGSGVSSISDFQVVSRPEVVRPSDTQSLSGVGGSPGDSPATRRMRMVKSLSQDAGCLDPTTPALTLHTSSSDSALHSKSVLSSTLRSTLGVTGYHGTQLSEVEESCSASDTGSINDLDGKKKKKKSFFNFRKKKDKTSS